MSHSCDSKVAEGKQEKQTSGVLGPKGPGDSVWGSGGFQPRIGGEKST